MTIKNLKVKFREYNDKDGMVNRETEENFDDFGLCNALEYYIKHYAKPTEGTHFGNFKIKSIEFEGEYYD